MKKVLGALLMLSMAIGGTVVAPNTTKDVQAATTIQSNRWYEGTVDSDNDQIYTYKMQNSGYFYYELVADEDGYYYKNGSYEYGSYYVITSMIKNYKLYVNNRYVSNHIGSFQSPIYAFKAGDNITIKLEKNDGFGGFGYKYHYRLKVTFVKVKNFEKENNDTRGRANKLKKGVTYTGLAMDGDTDWYVFKATKTKKYKIKAVCTNQDYCHQEVEAFRGYKSKGYASTYAGEGWKTVFSGKLKKGQKVYVKVSDGGDDEMYKLRVK